MTVPKKIILVVTLIFSLILIVLLAFLFWFLSFSRTAVIHGKAEKLSMDLQPAVDYMLQNNIVKYETFILSENNDFLCKTLTAGQNRYINDQSCDHFDDREFELFDQESQRKFDDLQNILESLEVKLAFVENWPGGKKSIHFYMAKTKDVVLPEEVIYKPEHGISFYQMSHADIYYSVDENWFYHGGRL